MEMEKEKQQLGKSDNISNKISNNESKTFFGATLRTLLFITMALIVFILCLMYPFGPQHYNFASGRVFLLLLALIMPIVIISGAILNFAKGISKRQALIIEVTILLAIAFITLSL